MTTPDPDDFEPRTAIVELMKLYGELRLTATSVDPASTSNACVAAAALVLELSDRIATHGRLATSGDVLQAMAEIRETYPEVPESILHGEVWHRP